MSWQKNCHLGEHEGENASPNKILPKYPFNGDGASKGVLTKTHGILATLEWVLMREGNQHECTFLQRKPQNKCVVNPHYFFGEFWMLLAGFQH